MPRPSAATVEDAIRNAVAPVVSRAVSLVAKAAANLAADQIRRRLETRPRPARATRAVRSRSRSEITRWVADRRARRVPNFVIAATGLRTKKQIVARYGDNVKFEKGRPLPKPQ